MRKLLNTLYVTTQGSYLSKEGETVAVKIEGQTVINFPLHLLDGIVCFGQISCSPALMGYCAEQGVTISFLTEYGRFLARVQGPVSGNVLLRREQYRRADDQKSSLELAKMFLTAKIANQRTVLQRALRDHGEKINSKLISSASFLLINSLKIIEMQEQLDALRGVEGEAANVYFSVFDHLIVAQKEHFIFGQRSRRPPLDNVNCLLSYLYVVLMHDCRSALETVGLDPAVGFLHRDRPGRYGLALDIMEEFRPYLADRLALSLINMCQVQPKDFTKTESGAVLMNDDARKTLLIKYQERKQDEITHPFLGEKIKIGQLFLVQAMLLARHLRGDMDRYPPFIWR